MILDRFSKMQTFILDVDGVLTNGTVQATHKKKFLRTFSIKDGFALQFAVKQGFRIIIISGGSSKGVVARLEGLGIKEVFTAVADKRKKLKKLEQEGLDLDTCVYIGDDYPDISVMEMCGLKVCPADAVWTLREKVDYITKKNGGEGAVREVLEIVLKLQDKWESQEHSVW